MANSHQSAVSPYVSEPSPPVLVVVNPEAPFQAEAARSPLKAQRVLIVGTGNRAKHLVNVLHAQSEGVFHILGYLDTDPARVGSLISGAPVLGTVDDIRTVLKESVVDEVIFAVPRSMLVAVQKIANTCGEEGVNFCLMADLFNVQVERMKLVERGSVRLLTLEPVAQAKWKLLIKRVMDLSIVLPLLPFTLIVMGGIAVAIKLDSRGPVFFVQERVGFRKRRFQMPKFRSMTDGADKLQEQVEHLNEAGGPIFKIANDPRLTRVGKFLRRSSLDELPQVLQVLSGKMSLVGPRPMSVRDVDRFEEGIQRRRFSVKPGLTCLWQISGRSNLPFSTWLELDLQYIKEWSLWLDFQILLKTIPAVLKMRGAF